MSRPLRFVCGCGGTGGHIFPGIAIARQLQQKGCQILFIGNRNSLESTLVAAEGFNFRGIRVQKLYRKLSLSNLLFPFLLLSSTLGARAIMSKFRPDAVICTGGFVSGPVALAAMLRRTPLYFHESNSYPGLTTRLLARYTRVTYTSFPDTAKYLPRAKVERLGIPLPERKPVSAATELHVSQDRKILLVTGGSQGSQAINTVVDAALPSLLERGYQIVWQTGNAGYALYSARNAAQKSVHVFDFSPRLSEYYRLAHIAVTRAGAMTLAELEANRLPAVLIPLPTAAGNHQYYNALEQQNRGLAVLLAQKELQPESLLAALDRIESDYDSYRDKLNLPPNHAARDIAAAILANLEKESDHVG